MPLQRVLILCLRPTPADANARRILDEYLQTGNAAQAPRQDLHHLIGRRTLSRRLEHDVDLAAVAAIERRHVARDVAVARDQRVHLLLKPLHLRKRRPLCGLRRGIQQAGVVARKEPLRNDAEYDAVQHEDDDGKDQCQGTMLHRPSERPFVAAKHCGKSTLERVVERPVRFSLVRGQESRAEHRRQGERDESGHHDGGADRDRELAEQAPDDASHEHQRNEHRRE